MDRTAGISQRRERFWGLVGGVVGSCVGVGSFLVASLIQRENWVDMVTSSYPPFFRRREMLPLDFYFLVLLVAGFSFLVVGLIQIRWGLYPRSDGFGAALLGTILCTLSSVIFFMRVWAVIH